MLSRSIPSPLPGFQDSETRVGFPLVTKAPILGRCRVFEVHQWASGKVSPLLEAFSFQTQWVSTVFGLWPQAGVFTFFSSLSPAGQEGASFAYTIQEGWTSTPCYQAEARLLASSACHLCLVCFWSLRIYFSYCCVSSALGIGNMNAWHYLYQEKRDLFQQGIRKELLLWIHLRESRWICEYRSQRGKTERSYLVKIVKRLPSLCGMLSSNFQSSTTFLRVSSSHQSYLHLQSVTRDCWDFWVFTSCCSLWEGSTSPVCSLYTGNRAITVSSIVFRSLLASDAFPLTFQ